MPLIHEHTDSLPYIDRPPSPTALAAADKLIQHELSSSTTSSKQQPPLHPLIPPAPEPNFTPLFTDLLSRLPSPSSSSSSTGAKEKEKEKSGIDLTRYNPTSSDDSSSDTNTTQSTLLRQAATNLTHLHTRLANLRLLEQAFGKHSWLVANAQLETVLRDLEADVVAVRARIESVNRERKDTALTMGEGVGVGVGSGAAGGEESLQALEAKWREGVAGLVGVWSALR